MRFWNLGGFFSSVKGHVIKWWQQVILPVIRINNNNGKNRMNQAQQSYPAMMETGMTGMQDMPENVDTAYGETVTSAPAGNSDDSTELARQKVLQMEKEAAERRQREIENAKRQAQEQERIASILNAGRARVDEFIEEGKAHRSTEDSEQAKIESILNAGRARVDEFIEEGKAHRDTGAENQEEMRRAQEILDRLNREAAEDEAKKQAEIAAAKKEAEETFG